MRVAFYNDMQKFQKEFHTLNYVIRESQNILLFAHSRPDGDTVGAALALRDFLARLGKNIDIACFDPFPEYLRPIAANGFEFPAHLDISKYNLIIASDSVERGFQKIQEQLAPSQVTALFDHHPDITIQGDITIIDPSYSSTCELIYQFLVYAGAEISRNIATYLMIGILSDTGMFQHANTTPEVLSIASELMKKGAPLGKIAQATFTTKNISTLKLWGKAFEKARINPGNGMISSILTLADMDECEATSEDIAQVASFLNTVPGTKFSLILSEREGGIVKGSLRSENYKEVDVSKIAATFGGGGHKLASGFELKGKIVETEEGWKIV
jgi:bifunctional oligoribonuclease and PAP phosphatase NrnA